MACSTLDKTAAATSPVLPSPIKEQLRDINLLKCNLSIGRTVVCSLTPTISSGTEMSSEDSTSQQSPCLCLKLLMGKNPGALACLQMLWHGQLSAILAADEGLISTLCLMCKPQPA